MESSHTNCVCVGGGGGEGGIGESNEPQEWHLHSCPKPFETGCHGEDYTTYLQYIQKNSQRPYICYHGNRLACQDLWSYMLKSTTCYCD